MRNFSVYIWELLVQEWVMYLEFQWDIQSNSNNFSHSVHTKILVLKETLFSLKWINCYRLNKIEILHFTKSCVNLLWKKLSLFLKSISKFYNIPDQKKTITRWIWCYQLCLKFCRISNFDKLITIICTLSNILLEISLTLR